MSNSEFRRIEKCKKCGCETAAEVEYHKDGKKFVLEMCKKCEIRKKEEQLQKKLSSCF